MWLFYEVKNKVVQGFLSRWKMVKTFIRIPKSGSTSIMASLAQTDAKYKRDHLTVAQMSSDGEQHEFYAIARDPLSQYTSMYYYAKGFVEQNLDFSDTPQPMLYAFIEHMKVIRQTTSLEEYLLNAPNNAFLGKYLSGMSPYDLLCVGLFDRFDESLKVIENVTGITMYPVHLKKNDYTPDTVSGDVLARFMSNNELEYDLYRQCVDYFNKLRF
jgi:hypothetical protein